MYSSEIATQDYFTTQKNRFKISFETVIQNCTFKIAATAKSDISLFELLYQFDTSFNEFIQISTF